MIPERMANWIELQQIPPGLAQHCPTRLALEEIIFMIFEEIDSITTVKEREFINPFEIKREDKTTSRDF